MHEYKSKLFVFGLFLHFSTGPVGRVVRWSWVNFQCRCVLLTCIIVGREPTALAEGAEGGCLDISSHLSFLSSFSLSLSLSGTKACLHFTRGDITIVLKL